MKKNTHPNYQQVLFVDSSTGYQVLCGSTIKTTHTETFEGKEYPAVHVSISSSSHPFFVGGKQFVDTEGRVDKFTKRYQKHSQQMQAKQEAQAAKKEESKTAKKAPKKTTKKAASAA